MCVLFFMFQSYIDSGTKVTIVPSLFKTKGSEKKHQWAKFHSRELMKENMPNSFIATVYQSSHFQGTICY